MWVIVVSGFNTMLVERKKDFPNLTRIDVFIGRRIQARREDAKQTRSELAAQLGIEDTVLSRYELGILRCPAAVLYLVGQALDVPIIAFFDGIELDRKQDAD